MGGIISRFLRDIRFLYRMISALQSIRKIGKQCKDDQWNIINFWEETYTKHKTKPALQFIGPSSSHRHHQRVTFEELNTLSNQFAHAALELNWNADDTVGLYISNCIEYIAIIVGMAKIGITCSLLNTNVTGESLMHCIKECGVTKIICGVNHVESIQSLEDVCCEKEEEKEENVMEHVYFLVSNEGDPTITTTSIPSFGKTLFYTTSAKTEPPPHHRQSISPITNPFLHIFTSGTTGLPKAAKINHLRFYGSSLIFVKLLQLQQQKRKNEEVLYCPLPFYHSSAIVLGLGISWHTGCEFVFREKFSSTSFWKDCVDCNATIIQYIGEICRYLLNTPVQEEEEKSHCVRIAIGNGLRPSIWKQFQNRFNINQIAEFYASTEGNFGFINTENKVGAVGFLSPIIQKKHPGKIVKYNYETNELYRDEISGKCVLCKPGEVGELIGIIDQTKDVTRRFDGYTNQSATEEKIVRNAFQYGDLYFRSGDLMYRDEEGYLYFHDRIGDTFRWKGENVSTAEVEGIIAASLEGKVEECVAYGVVVPGCEGKAGMILIKSSCAGESFDLKQLFTVIKEKLPHYARPYFVRLCGNNEKVDVTGTYKYRKTVLVEEGYDPGKVVAEGATTRLFFREKEEFVPLDDKLFQRITSGEIRL